MVDFALIMSVVNQARQWLEFSNTNDRHRDEEYEEALGALYTALNETRIYIGSLERHRLAANRGIVQAGSGRNLETEAKLSRLWTAASVKLRRFNHDLAVRSMMKGDYWANPEEWTDRDIRRARIQIDSVFREARRLL
jgi:ATP-dependent protease HslVU (ClpYQ) peptidase subunit